MNITLVLPGKCNAKCAFCFWDEKTGRITPPSDYIARVERLLLTAPSGYDTVSVTGGEPTLSPYFAEVVAMLRRVRAVRPFARIGLNTNGVSLRGGALPAFPLSFYQFFDHINLSRHHYHDAENARTFGTASIPVAGDILALDGLGLPITLNCVIEPNVSLDFIRDYVAHAKALGISSVMFREKAVSGKLPQFYEGTAGVMRNRVRLISDGGCPVCRSFVFKIDGVEVTWKQSAEEPSIASGEVYEMVILPDGNAYSDWSGKIPLVVSREELLEKEVAVLRSELLRARTVYSGGSSNCGTRSSGCGGRGYSSGCGSRSSGC